MTTVTFKGTPVHLTGTPPTLGQSFPNAALTKSDLSRVSLSDFAGKTVLLNIYPSVDTGVCFKSVQKFNELAGSNPDLIIACVSMDLPFASGRVAAAEGLDKVIFLSDFNGNELGKATGLTLKDGPLAGVLARTVIILDKDQKVKYLQLVPEITDGPDYDAAMKAL
jgi:thioredoxin-dependent peroxiredoxin